MGELHSLGTKGQKIIILISIDLLILILGFLKKLFQYN